MRRARVQRAGWSWGSREDRPRIFPSHFLWNSQAVVWGAPLEEPLPLHFSGHRIAGSAPVLGDDLQPWDTVALARLVEAAAPDSSAESRSTAVEEMARGSNHLAKIARYRSFAARLVKEQQRSRIELIPAVEDRALLEAEELLLSKGYTLTRPS